LGLPYKTACHNSPAQHLKGFSTFSTSLGQLRSNLFVPLRFYQSGNHAQIFTGFLNLELQSLTFQLIYPEMTDRFDLPCGGVHQDDYQK